MVDRGTLANWNVLEEFSFISQSFAKLVAIVDIISINRGEKK